MSEELKVKTDKLRRMYSFINKMSELNRELLNSLGTHESTQTSIGTCALEMKAILAGICMDNGLSFGAIFKGKTAEDLLTRKTSIPAGAERFSNYGEDSSNLFWECGCDTNFIHPKIVLRCGLCGVEQDDAPDSRINEVWQYFIDFCKAKSVDLKTAMAEQDETNNTYFRRLGEMNAYNYIAAILSGETI